MKKLSLLAVAVVALLWGVGLLLADPEPQNPVPIVSGVTMRQVAFSRTVEITYKLAHASAIITLAIETNGVALPDSAVTLLTGDVCKMVEASEATKHITWSAGIDWPENMTDQAVARVTAWMPDAPPEVIVVDLRKGTLVSPSDPYPVLYYPSIAALPDGVESTIYKNELLVLKKISHGNFSMGEASGAKNVILSEDFYLGVYETTQGQWYNVTGKNPASFIEASSRALRPIERVSYYDIRESVDNTANINYSWPSKGSAVHPNSFMGKLRTYTVPNILFDLPTEAQWEYACRAGTVTYYSDGRGTPSNTHSNEFMDSLGRYAYNGGKVWDGSNWNDPPSISDITHGTTVVGSYLPNPWGLYDLHGNVHEWCLDWYGGASMFGGDDPVGPSSADYRVIRGGAWNSEALDCKSTSRSSYFGPSSCYYAIGFRIAAKVVSMPSVPEE